MKILSLVPYKIFPAEVGGQKGIALFNEYLAKECELYCITVKSNDSSYAKGYSLFNKLSTHPLRYVNPFYFFTIKNIISKYGITHLILEHPYYGWLGVLLKKILGIQLVIHSHNIEALRWKNLGKWWWKILYWYEGATHRAASLNFFIHNEDRLFAISHYGLSEKKCITITYGFEMNRPPDAAERDRCKKLLLEKHSINGKDKLLLFNGALNYAPNEAALRIILDKINPLLLKKNLAYKIIICGRNLPADFNDLKEYIAKNIIYAGFADDITVYFKGADVFINPVIDGGGIKTKLVEALGYNMDVVSTSNGATGIPIEITGNKMKIIETEDWGNFAELVAEVKTDSDIPPAFFHHFYWGAIAKKVKTNLSILDA